MMSVSTLPRPLEILNAVGNMAPPIPVTPASRMRLMMASGSFSSLPVRGLRSSQGVSWKSFSITTDITMSPSMWRRGSTATTLPETEACTGAEIGASVAPMSWPIFTVSPTLTTGWFGAPMCWTIGSTTSLGGAMGRTGDLAAVFSYSG